jgi:serine/threonine protein kinase
MTGRGDGRTPHSNDAAETPESGEPWSRHEGLGARARERVGSVIVERFRLDALLGVGGSAAVFAATELETSSRFAVKVLHPELSAREDLVRRFMREGAIAKKLDHPALVPIFEDGRMEDGSVFLVMELLEGHTLERWATFEERLPIVESLRVAEDVLDLLTTAHEAGIVHRDIKPANVFRMRSGEIRVLDFGIARFFEGGGDGVQTQHGAGMGTPSFMPPEQARGRWNLVDGRTDVWAVGAVLFSLVSGEKPRIADTTHEELLLAMTQPVRSVLEAAPKLPTVVSDVIDRALAFTMDDRFTSARAMQSALRAARETLEDASPASAPTRPDLLVPDEPVESASVVFVGTASPPDEEAQDAPASGVPASGRPPMSSRLFESQGIEPATVPRSGAPSGSLGSLTRSVIGYDPAHSYIIAAPEGGSLLGIRIHRGIVLWHHPVPEGPLWLSAFGRVLVVAAGQALSTVDLVSGEVGIRTVLPRPIDPDDRVPSAPALLAFRSPQPVYVARASGTTLFSVHAAHGTIIGERTFPARVEFAPWQDVLLVLYNRTLEMLDPVTLATVAAPGRAPVPDPESVISVTVEGPLLLVSGEKRGIFGGGSFVGVIDGRTMEEPIGLRERVIDPNVRPAIANGGIVAALRTNDGHGLLAWPSGATAGVPIAGRRIVALANLGSTLFTVLADANGAVALASVDAATLEPRFAYGPVSETTPLSPPAALGAAPVTESYVQKNETRALVLAPTVPTHPDARSFDTRAGGAGWSRSLVDVGLVEGWGFVAGALVVRGARSLRALEPRAGTVVARF